MIHSPAVLPRYTAFDPRVPVWCATPDVDRCIHRFFDTSPFSPSGRYLALTQLAAVDRLPEPGDPGYVVVVDLHTGEEEIVAGTHGCDTQLGAQVQWGASDRELFFNDVDLDTWQPFGVAMDPHTEERRRLDGPVYMISPDGTQAAGPCLRRTGVTQAGYGVIVPEERVPLNPEPATDDGLFVTDTQTGECRLLASMARIVEEARPAFDPGRYEGRELYGFHVKWNLQGTRLMFVVRWRPQAGGKAWANVVTMRADGSDICVAIPDSEWSKGGHHPNWTPDGDWVMMNLRVDGVMRLVKARYDGSGLQVMSDAVIGSGHPSLHPDGRHVVTDTYVQESVAFGDGTTPIRWIDLAEGTAENIIRVWSEPRFKGPRNELRVDPHPAWDRDFTHIAFNACEDGKRRVYVADMRPLLGG